MLRTSMLAAALALAGCGSSSKTTTSTTSPYEGGAAVDAAPDDGIDAGASEPDASEANAVDAPTAASTCAPLGAPCSTSATCLCGLGAGCPWDNVECRAGTCQLVFACDQAGVCDGSAGPLLPMLDAGDACCSQCELTYDQGGSLAGWLTCNAQCGPGACPVRCLAE